MATPLSHISRPTRRRPVLPPNVSVLLSSLAAVIGRRNCFLICAKAAVSVGCLRLVGPLRNARNLRAYSPPHNAAWQGTRADEQTHTSGLPHGALAHLMCRLEAARFGVVEIRNDIFRSLISPTCARHRSGVFVCNWNVRGTGCRCMYGFWPDRRDFSGVWSGILLQASTGYALCFCATI
jgi:hypothetical protein